MTHDPATLAAVREAIAGYRGAVSQHLTPTEAYNLGKVDAMKAVASLAAPPQPPKRVEGYVSADNEFYRNPTDPRMFGGGTFVCEWPGVTDAASAEAFERAVRKAVDVLTSLSRYDEAEDERRALDALAPFLPPETPR